MPPNPTRRQPSAPLTSDAARLPLDVNQQQRLQQLQLQNKNLDEPVRQQQIQIQQLQFDRENQAQSLHDQIMRDSRRFGATTPLSRKLVARLLIRSIEELPCLASQVHYV